MKSVLSLIIILVFVVSFTGCTVLDSISDESAEKVAQGVQKYCANTDEDFRSKFREKVNTKASPHSVKVECR